MKENHKSLNLNLEWYVLSYSWDEKKVTYTNIFRSAITEEVEEALKKYTNYKEFKEKINRLLIYHFWSKAEWEIMVGGLFEEDKDKCSKIDVYYQLKPNLDNLCKYIIDKYNNRKYGRKRIEI